MRQCWLIHYLIAALLTPLRLATDSPGNYSIDEEGYHLVEHDKYKEGCEIDSQCPDYMHCQAALCICHTGYTFSHPLASCEQSRKIFRQFQIVGPSRLYLKSSKQEVEFRAKIGGGANEAIWRYRWVILDGDKNAKFSGINGPVLTLTELKPGFILFGLSISNDESEGYMPYNLTIIEAPVESSTPSNTHTLSITLLQIMECGKLSDRQFIQIWMSRKQLKLCENSGKKIISHKWARIDHSLNPIDISGSTTSVLELSNFVVTDKFNPYEFLLTVMDANKHSSNATVKVFVLQQSQHPVIKVQNVTIELPTNSIILEAHLPEDSINPFDTFLWEQTEGPIKLELRDQNSLNLTIGGIKIPGHYTFRITGKDSHGFAHSEAVAHLKVEESTNGRPILYISNVTVTLPSNPILLEPQYWRNIHNFLWEPSDDIPASLLLYSDFNGPKMILGPFSEPGSFLIRLTGFGQFGTASTVIEIGVKGESKERIELLAMREIGQPFLFGEQKSLLRAIEQILDIEFGKHFKANMTKIDQDESTGTLSLELIFEQTFGELATVRSSSDFTTALRNNATFYDEFRIISIKSISCPPSSSSCSCDSIWTQNPFRLIFGTDPSSNDCSWSTIYLWPFILLFLLFLAKLLHFLWISQESEKRAFESLKLALSDLGRRAQSSIHTGRFSPIGMTCRGRKKKDSVSKAINFADVGSLAVDESSDYDYDYDEDDETSN